MNLQEIVTKVKNLQNHLENVRVSYDYEITDYKVEDHKYYYELCQLIDTLENEFDEVEVDEECTKQNVTFG